MPLSKSSLDFRKAEYQKRFSSRSRDFITIRPPTATEGYEYLVKCLGEIREFTPRTGPNAGIVAHVIDVQYLSGPSGDPALLTGTEYTLNLGNVVLAQEMKKLGSLAGVTLSIINLGKRPGKKYYDFDIHVLPSAD
ncbi:MAG: hypothetical protein ACYC9R_12905 [Nitrosotalea sp.]